MVYPEVKFWIAVVIVLGLLSVLSGCNLGSVEVDAEGIEFLSETVEALVIVTTEQQEQIEVLATRVETLNHLFEIHLGEAGI